MAKRKFVLGRFIIFILFIGSGVAFYWEMSQKFNIYTLRKEQNMRALINYFEFRDKDFYKNK